MNFLKISSAVLLFAVTLATSTVSATCTNATLTGVWGYEVGSAVGQIMSNGAGSLTGSQTVSQGGTIVKQTFTGTYSLNGNCTGSLTVHITGGTTAHLNFVLDEANKGFQIIETDSGTLAGGVGLAKGTATCGLTGINQTFAALLLGKIPAKGPAAYVAQVILDGKGSASGVGTFNVNGAIFTASFTGKYTEAANCTGTMQITPTGHSALHFNLVVVSAGKEILLLETDTGTVIAGNMQQ
ncbi:MAG TPA: hypothetical protein VFO39_10545 [Candidatus Sulfotelmatobacter sp.]|nr:hypothetical protein [Candidatus Sulfotelmatobacter sp.]